MYSILLHAHSGLRWVLLLLLLAAIFNAGTKMGGKKTYTDKDKRLGLFALIFSHLQLLIGVGLYFLSAKVLPIAEAMGAKSTRFFAVEHLTMMIIGIILITIGYSRAKRKLEDSSKFKTTFWFYLLGLLIILAGIPWPFLYVGFGSGWY
jgi:cell division protein FtsW (lipid II flippase)